MMFLSLLAITFTTSTVVVFIAFRVFDAPLRSILRRIVGDDLVMPWHRYVRFAAYVEGVTGGVRIYDFGQLLAPRPPGQEREIFGPERWTFEIYKTVIGSL